MNYAYWKPVCGLLHTMVWVHNLTRGKFSHVTFFYAYLFIVGCKLRTITPPSTEPFVIEGIDFLYSFRLLCFVCNSKFCTRWPTFMCVVLIYTGFFAIPSIVLFCKAISPNITRCFERSIQIYTPEMMMEDPYHRSVTNHEVSDIDKEPILNANHTHRSYIGHDAVFTCSQPGGFNAPAWINTNDRHTISENYHEREEIISKEILKYNPPMELVEFVTNNLRSKYNFTSQIQIRDIEEKDFKVYRCLYDALGTVIADDFYLKKLEFETVEVNAAPGTLISMLSYYTHLDNSEDITIYHTLNGKIITFDGYKCPYLLLYYFYSTRTIDGLWQLINSLQRVIQVEEQDTPHLRGNRLTSFTAWCMTPELYGLHSTVVVRRFQNTSGSLCSIKHINQPLSLNIKYTESNSFENTGRNSESTNLETDCWGPAGEPDSKICRVTKLWLANEAKLIYKTDRDYILVMLVSVILFLILLWYIFNILRGGVEMETIAGISDRRNAEDKYNIFISCVQQDYRFVLNKILPILENKLGRKVFVPVRDVPPGRPIPTDTGEAIGQSASFIVIASRRYIKDKKLNEFEINMILQNANSRNLIIIRLDDCYIDGIFNNKYQVLDLRKQHNHFQLKKILETLPLYKSPWMKRVKMALGISNMCIGLCTTLTQIRVLLNCLMLLWMVLNGTDVDD